MTAGGPPDGYRNRPASRLELRSLDIARNRIRIAVIEKLIRMATALTAWWCVGFYLIWLIYRVQTIPLQP